MRGVEGLFMEGKSTPLSPFRSISEQDRPPLLILLACNLPTGIPPLKKLQR